MMADTEDAASEALSLKELDAAHKLGMSVRPCPVCQRPTLWKRNPTDTNAPSTCGRQKCIEAVAK